MKDYALHATLAEIWRVVADANRYFAGQEPWAKRKTDPERMNTILWTTAEVLRNVAIMAQPFIPQAAGKLLDLVAAAPDRRAFEAVGQGGQIAGGQPLPAPVPIFPRYVEAEEGATPRS
jgi:methionyl-tRNA synthetase